MSAKLICVWGSPSSGKTVLSLALGAALATQKSNVIVYNGDKLTPMLKVFVPSADIESSQSIGPLLMSGRFDDTIFAQRLVVHPECDYLCFIGMAPSDTYITYDSFGDEPVMKVLNKMMNLAEYVIVDCTANPIDDNMSQVAMGLADYKICCITADTRGISYMDSARMIYSEDRFDINNHIMVVGNVKNVSPLTELMRVSGKYDYVLPYSPEIENRYIGGELLTDLKRMASRDFSKEIKRLAKRIVEDNHGKL